MGGSQHPWRALPLALCRPHPRARDICTRRPRPQSGISVQQEQITKVSGLILWLRCSNFLQVFDDTLLPSDHCVGVRIASLFVPGSIPEALMSVNHSLAVLCSLTLLRLLLMGQAVECLVDIDATHMPLLLEEEGGAGGRAQGKSVSCLMMLTLAVNSLWQ